MKKPYCIVIRETLTRDVHGVVHATDEQDALDQAALGNFHSQDIDDDSHNIIRQDIISVEED